jgi:hypothetical protein
VIVEGVKGVEKRFLGLVFTLQELDIVNQENIDVPILSLKKRSSVVLDGINKVVGELFRGNVANLDFWVKVQRVVTDRVQKVSLAKPRTTIDKQRVIGLGWGLGNSKCGCVGKPVGPPGYEVVKVVFRIQPGIKQHADSPGFARIFFTLKRGSRANWIDVFRGFAYGWICLNVRVYHNRKVGRPPHQGILL